MQDQIKSMLTERHKVEAEMKAEIYRLRKVIEDISKKRSSTLLIDLKAPNNKLAIRQAGRVKETG